MIRIIEEAYGAVPGDPHWNPEADLNNDGIVNYRDLGIASATVSDDVPDPVSDVELVAVPFVVAGVIIYAFVKLLWK